MEGRTRSEYLEAKVNTASPAQLHLMLIDGALRFGRQAEKGLLRGDEEAAHPPLLRAMDIVGEMLAGVRGGESEVNEKLTKLYEFVYARLTSVYVNTDHKRMAEALRILEYERETWRQACEKAAGEASAGKAPKAFAPKPHLGTTSPSQATGQGLSLDA